MRVLGPPVLLIASLFGSGLAMAAEQPPSAAQMMDDELEAVTDAENGYA